jgi:hypothetical protein
LITDRWGGYNKYEGVCQICWAHLLRDFTAISEAGGFLGKTGEKLHELAQEILRLRARDGYIDFQRLHALHLSGAFFVTRVKDNAKYRVVVSRLVEKETGLRCDQSICLTGAKTSSLYPENLRRIKFLIRRQELFFKWIKQHLRIKSFYGTSENAVRVQIWTAITAYVLLAIVRKRLGLRQDLYAITQILRLHLFVKTPVLSLFFEPPEVKPCNQSYNQLSLFE